MVRRPPYPPSPDPDEHFRIRAARKSRDSGALVGALANPSLAALAAGYLGDIEAREAADDLRSLLGSEEPYTRAAAAKSLGKLRDHGSLPALVKLAGSDAVPFVRAAALIAAGKVGDRESLSAVLDVALSGADWQPRFAAAEVLAEIGVAEDVPQLQAAKRADNLLRRGPYRKAVKEIRRREGNRRTERRY